MKKIVILGYLILGAVIFQISQTFFDKRVFANTSFFETSKNKTNSSLDFTYAAEKSVEAVVHIKSKIMEDEYYRYYHPFFGQGYYNQPTEKVASGSGVVISHDVPFS